VRPPGNPGELEGAEPLVSKKEAAGLAARAPARMVIEEPIELKESSLRFY
jgi:hypothetical protein